jgi:DNA-binding SARP family transcriptional activator
LRAPREVSLRSSASLLEAGADATPYLGLLGGFEFSAGAQPVALPPHVQRLLAFLALQGRPLHRAYVAGRLWIDLSQDRAHGSLRTTLWRMRRLSCPAVEATSTHLALAATVSVDAREFEACTDRVLHHATPPWSGDVELLAQPAELLPDWYDDWVIHERERLRQLRLLALEVAAERLIHAHRYAEAAFAALTARATDPLRESACRLLVRSYLAEGNAAEALHQIDAFRAQLQLELGLEPSAQMQDLRRAIT